MRVSSLFTQKFLFSLLIVIFLRQSYEYVVKPFIFEGNTGFYLVRSNAQTITWYDKIMKHWGWDYTRRIDQEIFWRAAIIMLDPKLVHFENCRDLEYPKDFPALPDNPSPRREQYLSSCMLDRCLFSARGVVTNETYGKYINYSLIINLYSLFAFILIELLTTGLKQLGETPLMVHANVIHGDEAKLAAMKNYGLWIVDVNKETGAYTCGKPHFKNF